MKFNILLKKDIFKFSLMGFMLGLIGTLMIFFGISEFFILIYPYFVFSMFDFLRILIHGFAASDITSTSMITLPLTMSIYGGLIGLFWFKLKEKFLLKNSENQIISEQDFPRKLFYMTIFLFTIIFVFMGGLPFILISPPDGWWWIPTYYIIFSGFTIFLDMVFIIIFEFKKHFIKR